MVRVWSEKQFDGELGMANCFEIGVEVVQRRRGRIALDNWRRRMLRIKESGGHLALDEGGALRCARGLWEKAMIRSDYRIIAAT